MRRNTNYLIITHEECLAWPGRISGLDNGLPGPSCPVLLSTYCDCAETGRGRGLLGTLCSACLDKHANKHINIQLGIFHAPWAEHGTHGHNPLSRVSPLRSGGRKVLAIGNFLLQRRYISWRGWKKVEVGLAGKCGKWQFWTSFWILKWKTVFAPPAPRITFTRVRVLKKPTNI